jgi:hypothetical protein
MIPTPDEKRAALEEVLGTGTFRRAGQLQSFLRLICEREIAGRAGEINEYLIGVEVLGRAEGYSPSQDSVVRRRAVDLREKLDEVYRTDLASAKLHIELPKGRYVPRFVVPELAPPADSAPAATSIVEPIHQKRWPLVAAFLAGAAFASATFMTASAWRARHSSAEAGTTYEAESKTNTLGGTVATELCDACSGGRRVRRIGNLPASRLTFTGVRADSGGPHTVVLYYLLKGDRTFFVSVNGGGAIEVPLEGVSWTQPAAAPITVGLRAGANTITLYNDTDFAPDLDRIVVRPASRR